MFFHDRESFVNRGRSTTFFSLDHKESGNGDGEEVEDSLWARWEMMLANFGQKKTTLMQAFFSSNVFSNEAALKFALRNMISPLDTNN